jgi:hypothetical protein
MSHNPTREERQQHVEQTIAYANERLGISTPAVRSFGHKYTVQIEADVEATFFVEADDEEGARETAYEIIRDALAETDIRVCVNFKGVNTIRDDDLVESA